MPSFFLHIYPFPLSDGPNFLTLCLGIGDIFSFDVEQWKDPLFYMLYIPFCGCNASATTLLFCCLQFSERIDGAQPPWESPPKIGVCHFLQRAHARAACGPQGNLLSFEGISMSIEGKDVVIAAETGSDSPKINLSEKASGPPHRQGLVLSPHVLLCERVVQMANGLYGENGEPLVRVAVKEPDIIVSTPAVLLNNIDSKKHHCMNFICDMKYVVFDEADMLLCGSFQNQVIRLMNMLHFDEKLLSQMSKSVSENPMEPSPESLSHFDLGDDEDITNEFVSVKEEDFEDNVYAEELIEGAKVGSAKEKDWRRVRKPYACSKQYIFVAATLPLNGKKTAGAVLKKMFPDAIWVSGNYLHCHNPRLEEKWIEVTVDTQVDALIDAVKLFRSKGSDYEAGISWTMVFAKTVEAVEAADFATSAVDFLHRVDCTARAGQYGLVLYTESNWNLVDAIHRAGKLVQPVVIP
ncbi:hypothetical protein SLEP1_g25323 [Rubroshorea leprosula]|uniref:Helicase ATP-binding domain-containing protein n=1 Tax=Rubroshorea leprosula TaxID=152421 RepID=A0AAV5JVX3_9ROSI|nr:hypothetical protein SLEP1_g25323 [Rubroshorea leprosula]